MKRIVITGATGFIGRWFVDECLSHNDKVLLLVSSKSKIPERWHNKDNLNTIVLPMEEYSTATVNFEADIFFNFAWNGTSGIKRSNEKEQLDNISYACNAIELAKKLGAKTFVNAGSIMEYEAIDNLIKDGERNRIFHEGVKIAIISPILSLIGLNKEDVSPTNDIIDRSFASSVVALIMSLIASA